MSDNINYIDPKDLNSQQISAIKTLYKRGYPAPICGGVVHCGAGVFRINIGMELESLRIMTKTETDLGECYTFTNIGKAIACKVQNWRVD
jgi:hypothetical protein